MSFCDGSGMEPTCSTGSSRTRCIPLLHTSLLLWGPQVSVGSPEELGFRAQALPEPPHHPQEMLFCINEPTRLWSLSLGNSNKNKSPGTGDDVWVRPRRREQNPLFQRAFSWPVESPSYEGTQRKGCSFLHYKGTAEGADFIVNKVMSCCTTELLLLFLSAQELSYIITVWGTLKKHCNEETLLAHTQIVCMWRWGLTFYSHNGLLTSWFAVGGR